VCPLSRPQTRGPRAPAQRGRGAEQSPELKAIEIEGHTDDSGNDDFNMDLSQRRAQAVVNFLIKEGVAADRLKAVGYGETRPVADNTSDKGRAANRRVEFKLLAD
jgi:OmpA-OmpF porin, OOP family